MAGFVIPFENSGKLTCLDVEKRVHLSKRKGDDFSIPRESKVKIFRREESPLMEDFRNKEVLFCREEGSRFVS